MLTRKIKGGIEVMILSVLLKKEVGRLELPDMMI